MTGSPEIRIADRAIGEKHPPYVVAELSANHGGNLDRALAIVEASKRAGADAVKIQTYTADTLTIDCDRPEFRIQGGLWDGLTLHELYCQAHTPWEWHPVLFAKARDLGITMFSSPFDATAVDFLEKLGVPAYKIASFELVDHRLIKRVAETGKPVILSTGMADLKEIGAAVAVTEAAGCRDLALMHCVSGYPTPTDQSNLRTMSDLSRRFGRTTGLSDHTLGTDVAVAAVALGASIIEKHVTLRRRDGGPDAAFSLEPPELETLCGSARTVWAALGKVDYGMKPSEEGNKVFRRSLFVVAEVAKGEPFTEANVRSIRPGGGLPPSELPNVLGRKAGRNLRPGTPLAWDLIGD